MQLYFLYYLKKGYVDANLTDRKKRLPFFALASISSLIAMAIFYIYDIKVLLIFSIAYFIGSSLIGLITNFWKVSMHTYGVAATITAIVPNKNHPQYFFIKENKNIIIFLPQILVVKYTIC